MTILHTREGEYTSYFHGMHATGYTYTEAIINLLTIL